MAYSTRGNSLPGISAGADLSTTGQHRFVTVDSTGRVVLTGAAGRSEGVLANNPIEDQAAEVQGHGAVAKVSASAAIAAGDSVASAANGQGRTAVALDFIIGVCVEAAGASGELCSVYITMPGKLPA